MVNLQYLTEPAHIPLSSHEKRCWREAEMAGALSSVPGLYWALVLTEWLTGYLPTPTWLGRTRARNDGGQACLLPAQDAPPMDLSFLFIGLFFNASLICKEIK